MAHERILPHSFLIALTAASLIHVFLILGFRYPWPRAGQPGRKVIAMTLVRPAAPPADTAAAAAHPATALPEPSPPSAVPALPPEPPAPAPATPPEAKPTVEPAPPPRTQPASGPIGPPAPEPGMQVIGPPAPSARVLKENRRKLAASMPPDATRAARQSAQSAPGAASRPDAAPKPAFSAELLSQQIAEVSADITRQRNAGLEGKKVVYASAMKTHRLAITAYEQAWQEKVERIGNLNFPDAARRDKLAGVLLVAVGIKPDGSVYSVQIQQSSGHAVLDEAARHIDGLAAPFAPLPEEIRDEVDILIITRTWRFDSNYRLETRTR